LSALSIWNPQQPQQPQTSQATSSSTSSSSIWAITPDEMSADKSIFNQTNNGGFVEGNVAVNLFSQSGVNMNDLNAIYTVSDCDQDGKLSINEFLAAMKMIRARTLGHPIPTSIPPELVQSITNPTTASTSTATSSQLYEQRISDLQDRINKADKEIAELKVQAILAKEEKEKALAAKSEFESRAVQAEARAQALGSRSQEESSQAMMKLNELSNLLKEQQMKVDSLTALNAQTEMKLQQANTQLQNSQSQLSNAQHLISVNAFSAQSQPSVTPSNPWGSPSTQSSIPFGGSSSLPPPPSNNAFGATPTSPFSGSSSFNASSSAPTSPFGGSSNPSPYTATSNVQQPPPNPFLMGVEVGSTAGRSSAFTF